jgi:hypothetical protein
MAAMSPPATPRRRIGSSAWAIHCRYFQGGWIWVASPVCVQIVKVARESTSPFGKLVKNDEKSMT